MSVTPASDSSTWLNRFWWLLAAVFIARIGVMLLFVNGADLAGDEAYYWDWGRRPDWCYYSKPPMIGWMMGVIGALTGNAEWGIRFAALLLGTATLVIIHRIALVLFDARTAFLAAVLVLLTIANAGLNLLLTIDAPLLLCWTLGLLLFWLAAQKPTCNTRWLALALVIGFGTLSKQMMLAFPALMLVFAAVSREDRALLRNPRMWLAILCGMAFIIPVLQWNQNHAWITLEHTKHHFDTSSLSFGRWLSRTGENVGLQALIYTPVTFAALVAAMIAAVKLRKQLSRPLLFVMLASAPALACFALLALRQRINPNWPAAFFVPAFILAAAWLRGFAPFKLHPGWERWSLRVGGALVLIVHLALVIIFSTELKGIDKLASLRGWQEAGIEAQEFLDLVPEPENTFVMALGHRYHAAEMAFYMPSHPRVYRWEPSDTVQSQYEIWPGPEERIGSDALILEPGPVAALLQNVVFTTAFEKIEYRGNIRIPLGKETREFSVYLARNLKSWKPVGSSIKAPDKTSQEGIQERR
ncbi:MAG: glycosyltransferase family 39 protein [Prosthecobacter sp.]|uniref:ArnT family glycosyltransferase n=1 Tax=Prosthecobacter sp. TaxID=1965333 RepID=UPI0025E2895A|nr:glycosyltransferase family 39 protein [Prosthecobacter sp.]MCF7786268.1 glycosyltransferase family 39 protein [Prosthecobacter sp.]